MTLATETIVLASGSAARRALLEQAGVPLEVDVPDVDEAIIKTALTADDDAIDGDDLAEVLARAKADRVGARNVGRVVVAGDQVMTFEGAVYSKPASEAAAQSQLLALRGKTHRLHSAVVIARDGDVVWAHVAQADITLREVSPEFVGRYLSAVGPAAQQSVGAYQLEGPGVQLIEKVRGDYFTVLGLPLLELLAELRRQDVLMT